MLPFVSVLMPVRNEASFIERSVGSVLSQDYPSDRLEILVADGRSTDATRSIVQRLTDADPRIALVDNPEGIVATGLNRALGRAKGEIIIRVDGHCEIAADYVSRCVRYLEDRSIHAVGGPLDTIGETVRARAIAAAMGSWFGVGGSAFRTVRERSLFTDTVAFPGYRREVMDRAGVFDEELVRNQDDEYNYRLRKMGARILLAADVRARYYSRSSFSSLWRQYFQYGYWKVRVMQKHPRQMQPRQFAPVLLILGLAAAAIVGLAAPGPIAWAAAVAPIAYLLGTLVAALRLRRTQHVESWWLLVPAFIVLHVSYGIGMLVGFARFWNRWGDRLATQAS